MLGTLGQGGHAFSLEARQLLSELKQTSTETLFIAGVFKVPQWGPVSLLENGAQLEMMLQAFEYEQQQRKVLSRYSLLLYSLPFPPLIFCLNRWGLAAG